MQIKPVILCGGAGTRLWPKSKKNLPKQFIDFGGWTLFQKTLQRIQNPLFEYPILFAALAKERVRPCQSNFKFLNSHPITRASCENRWKCCWSSHYHRKNILFPPPKLFRGDFIGLGHNYHIRHRSLI